MRATINFEVDVGRVQETMAAVVREELHPLHQAMDLLEISQPQDLLGGIGKALEILGAVATQLEQYRDMLTAFEKARFETILPQPAMPTTPMPLTGKEVRSVAELKETIESMKDFDSFLDGISPAEGDRDDPEEG